MPAVVCVYSQCKDADDNLHAWRTLASESKAKFLLLDLRPGRDSTNTLALPRIPSLSSIPPDIVCKYKLRTFPQTILVNRRREVIRVFTGKLSSQQISEIKRLTNS
ncbi:MAG: hypothetical protein K2X35_19190 [Bryobacteraceae bacterium]|nr:hypothetical protein [Bryobacteraceae bacterium]